MNLNKENFYQIKKDLIPNKAELVAVSKLQPVSSIRALYELGQRDFGENYVQECCEKHELLPDDIRWHFIGHLQTNKVKFLSPFISLIHGVDSLKLLSEINKQAKKLDRIQDVLLQIHISQEETKFGFSFDEAWNLIESTEISSLRNIRILGLMGMASFSHNMDLVRKEFKSLSSFYRKLCESKSLISKELKYLSMGMTSDYKIALEEGSNMVRIGSALFGERIKSSE